MGRVPQTISEDSNLHWGSVSLLGVFVHHVKPPFVFT